MQLHFIPKYSDNILFIDPSGNGITGIGIYNSQTNEINLMNVALKDFNNNNEYIDELVKLINLNMITKVYLEDFVLYQSKRKVFTYQKLLTAELVGILKYHCYLSKKECIVKKAAIHKTVDDKYLKSHYNPKEISKLSTHQRDCLRMVIYYFKAIKN